MQRRRLKTFWLISNTSLGINLFVLLGVASAILAANLGSPYWWQVIWKDPSLVFSYDLGSVTPGLSIDADRQAVMVLVVGYDREICTDSGSLCRDSSLSKAFRSTGHTLEGTLPVSEVVRIDVKDLDLTWLNTEKTIRETPKEALLRTLGEAGAAISHSGGRVSAIVFVGHGIGAGNVGLSFGGESVNILALARAVQLAKRGAIIVLACSVAVQMDLSQTRADEYSVFATTEWIDWLENGKVKFSRQNASEYTLASNFLLPEQSLPSRAGGLKYQQLYQTIPTVQKALLQAVELTASAE